MGARIPGSDRMRPYSGLDAAEQVNEGAGKLGEVAAGAVQRGRQLDPSRLRELYKAFTSGQAASDLAVRHGVEEMQQPQMAPPPQEPMQQGPIQGQVADPRGVIMPERGPMMPQGGGPIMSGPAQQQAPYLKPAGFTYGDMQDLKEVSPMMAGAERTAGILEGARVRNEGSKTVAEINAGAKTESARIGAEGRTKSAEIAAQARKDVADVVSKWQNARTAMQERIASARLGRLKGVDATKAQHELLMYGAKIKGFKNAIKVAMENAGDTEAAGEIKAQLDDLTAEDDALSDDLDEAIRSLKKMSSQEGGAVEVQTIETSGARGPGVTGGQKAPSKRIRVQGPNGQTGTMDESELSQHPGWKRI